MKLSTKVTCIGSCSEDHLGRSNGEWRTIELEFSQLSGPGCTAASLMVSWSHGLPPPPLSCACQTYLDRPANERDDINIMDHKGRTALHHAALCLMNTNDLVLLLLRRGAYVHAVTDRNFLTPLHCACVKGSLDAARILIKYGLPPPRFIRHWISFSLAHLSLLFFFFVGPVRC